MNIREARVKAAQLRAEAMKATEAYHRTLRDLEGAQRAFDRAREYDWARVQRARINRLSGEEQRIDSDLKAIYQELAEVVEHLPEEERESAFELHPGQADGEPDWSVLAEPEVRDIAARAARKVARLYGLEEVDLYQDAALLIALKAEWVRAKMGAGKPNHVFTDVSRDLENAACTAARRGPEASLEAMLEAGREDEDAADLELADGDVPIPPAKIRNGEYGGKMMGLRWAAPNGSAGGRVTVRRVAA